MRKPVKLKKLPAPYRTGHHIFAYRNFRTNQVLYSLTYELRNEALEQLPDLGANSKPPTIRRDSWRPFYSVSLPDTPLGKVQCLDTYEKLLNYKKLHELYWEPPPELERQFTEKQIERMKERLEKRGGSKKETVYDVIARQKWKMRVNHIMNQKANSIADLAAVFLEQEDLEEQGKRDELRDQQTESMIVTKLAEEADTQGLNWMRQEWEELEDSLKDDSTLGRRRTIRKEIEELKRKEKESEYVLLMVKAARELMDMPETERTKLQLYWKTKVDLHTSKEDASTSAWWAHALREQGCSWARIAAAAKVEARHPDEEAISALILPITDTGSDDSLTVDDRYDVHNNKFLEDLAASRARSVEGSKSTEPGSTPPREIPDIEASAPASKDSHEGPPNDALSKNDVLARESGASAPGTARLEITRFIPPIPLDFAPLTVDIKLLSKDSLILREIMDRRIWRPKWKTEGIVVRWDHPLDAEFAQEWPPNVQHESLGRILGSQHPDPRGEYQPKEQYVDDMDEEEEEAVEVAEGEGDKQLALEAGKERRVQESNGEASSALGMKLLDAHREAMEAVAKAQWQKEDLNTEAYAPPKEASPKETALPSGAAEG
ncbi:Hypothetical predicted protein [Lecanosticta acicola]|uniref:Large ribosomal subunit protein mL67 n=1 Tax=Lecanosticta acicola TaxID=111012 RepID=A0AAI9E6M4_9PEZI|nr:Hypothetical predicted protein [Lecanosticta acicola]